MLSLLPKATPTVANTSLPVRNLETISSCCTQTQNSILCIHWPLTLSLLPLHPLSPLLAPDSTGHRTITFLDQTGPEPSFDCRPLSSTFPVYEITVTALFATTHEYYCKLSARSTDDIYSNHFDLTVAPLLTFNSSMSSEGQRLATCAVGASLNLTGKAHSVQFWSSLGPKWVNLLAEYTFGRK